MDLKKIDESKARMPFKPVQGTHGVKFRQHPTPGETGSVIEIEHDGHDKVMLDIRERYRLSDGQMTSQRTSLLPFDSQQAAQLASVLQYFVDEHMRDDAEAPFQERVTTKERAAFGSNWLIEEQETAIERLNRRQSRNHLMGLVQRCLELCEDDRFVRELCMNLALWAKRSGDGFARQKAEQALYQLGMVPRELNP